MRAKAAGRSEKASEVYWKICGKGSNQNEKCVSILMFIMGLQCKLGDGRRLQLRDFICIL